MIVPSTAEDNAVFQKLVDYVATPAFKGIKLMKNSEVQAMVGLDNWTENSVQIHIWIGNKSSFSRKFIKEVFNHIFVTCGKGILVGVTPGDNAEALEFNRKIGLREVYRLEDGNAVGVATVLQMMRKEECKWL